MDVCVFRNVLRVFEARRKMGGSENTERCSLCFIKGLKSMGPGERKEKGMRE